jgi:hypothetical protein
VFSFTTLALCIVNAFELSKLKQKEEEEEEKVQTN